MPRVRGFSREPQSIFIDAHRLAETALGDADVAEHEGAANRVEVVPYLSHRRERVGERAVSALEVSASPASEREEREARGARGIVALGYELERPRRVLQASGRVAQCLREIDASRGQLRAERSQARLAADHHLRWSSCMLSGSLGLLQPLFDAA